MARKPKLLSLYSGAGGLDYGFEAAGFETSAAVEWDHDCCETLRANRDWPVIERSIYDVPTDEILAAAKLRRGQPDILVGGPPCQPFSKSGYWSKGDALRLEDPRAKTLAAYLRVVEEALPRVFLLENVHGIAYAGKSEGVSLLLREIEAINKRTGANYVPHYRVIKAVEYGVPQLRERFFMIASREGTPFEFPEPDELMSPRTAWDAIGDLDDPSADEDVSAKGKWANLLPSIPEGQNYQFHTERGAGLPLFGWRRHFWCFLLKLAKSQPAWTLQAQPGPAVGPFHWKNRRLTMRELCRLQTFPDDVHITGGRGAIQKQVGNAVPSLLAEVLARAIRTQLLGLPAMRGGLKLLPKHRGRTPAPEVVQGVAAEYLHLAGEHEAHPGTGRGYAAAKRDQGQSTEHP